MATDLSVVGDACCRERMSSAKELVQHQFDLRDEALGIQAKANEKHFDTLNNNMKMILAERGIYFTKDGHQAYIDTHQRQVDQFRAEINALQQEVASLNMKVVTWMAAMVIGLGAFSTFLHIFWKP